MRRDFSLLHGDVDNLVRAGAIASRVDVRHVSLHSRIRNDPTACGLYAGVFKAQPCGVGLAAQRKQHFISGNSNRLVVVLEGDLLPFAFPPGVEQMRSREQPNAFPAEDTLHYGGGVFVKFLQNVRTALDHSDAHAKTHKELRQLARNRSATQHDQ